MCDDVGIKSCHTVVLLLRRVGVEVWLRAVSSLVERNADS